MLFDRRAEQKSTIVTSPFKVLDRLRIELSKPSMHLDLLEHQSFTWICAEKLLEKLDGAVGKKVRKFEVALQDLFIQESRIWVLER